MARYKGVDTQPRFLPIDLARAASISRLRLDIRDAAYKPDVATTTPA
jgi:hypothetical protein